jgi:hypothetical protein
MKGGIATKCGASKGGDSGRAIAADVAVPRASVRTDYVPLDIADPDGRFGDWMPGDDLDDWR